MQEMLKAIKEGDAEIREKFITGNLRLVLSVIQRFSYRNENPDDLFQVGCIGLIKAIDNFDLSHGVKFSTYAVPMIIGEVRRYLRDNNSIRVSRSLRDIAYKALQAKERLSTSLGCEPTLERIAREIDVPVEDIVMAIDSIQEPVSLYEPVFHDDGDAIYVMDQVGEAGCEENWISSIQFRDTVSKLSDREKKIMSLRYLAGKTQVEVAGEIGISQAQVSRLEKNALERIKKQL